MDTHDDGIKVVAVHVPDGVCPVPGVAHGDGRIVTQLLPLVLVQRVVWVRDHREVKPDLNGQWRVLWLIVTNNQRGYFILTVSVRIHVTSQEN